MIELHPACDTDEREVSFSELVSYPTATFATDRYPNVGDVAQALSQTTAPFFCRLEQGVPTSRWMMLDILGFSEYEAQRNSILVLPFHRYFSGRGACYFAGSSLFLDARIIGTLFFEIQEFVVHLRISERENTKNELGMTDRELDCLEAAARGLTSIQTAKLLDLSPYTVNHYIRTSAEKLNAVNRQQSVAKAIRAGLIGE